MTGKTSQTNITICEIKCTNEDTEDNNMDLQTLNLHLHFEEGQENVKKDVQIKADIGQRYCIYVTANFVDTT